MDLVYRSKQSAYRLFRQRLLLFQLMPEVVVVAEEVTPFFTTTSLARYLALSERTIRELIKRQEIPSYKVAGARRIAAVDVESWLAKRRQEKVA